MSMLTDLFERMLGHSKKNEEHEVTYVTCYECRGKFWGFSEDEAYYRLYTHALVRHPIDFDAEAAEVDEEIGFRSEIRDRLYGKGE